MKWGRIRTSGWHLIHSIRAGTTTRYDWTNDARWSNNLFPIRHENVPYEFLLTYDGFQLPTTTAGGRDSAAKVWEGEGLPTGKVCNNCSSFLAGLKDTVQLDD
jgi:hypothetical protein